MAKRTYEYWEPWEENILRTKYKTNTAPQIQQKYLPHRTIGAIRHQLTQLNLTIPSKHPRTPPWTEEETNIIAEHYTYKTAAQIQEEFLPHRTVYAIRNQAHSIGAVKHKKPAGNKNKRVSRTRWTEKETVIINEHGAAATLEELATMLPKKTTEQIRRKLNDLGFTKTNHTPWTQEELKILKENAAKSTLRQLCDLIPTRSRSAIYSKLLNDNIPVLATPYILWTETEINILKENENLSTKELVALLPNRNPNTIRNMRCRLRKKAEKNQQTILTKTEDPS